MRARLLAKNASRLSSILRRRCRLPTIIVSWARVITSRLSQFFNISDVKLYVSSNVSLIVVIVVNIVLQTDVEIPRVRLDDNRSCARVNMKVRQASERIKDFELIEEGMTCEEACQEARRCIRCDHFGFGILKGGRIEKW